MIENRLKYSSSPYLLQHAKDPVHWQTWDEDSLALARAEKKPILLSIGYSACHWCHVMAHESFADEQIASIMNEHFVNIKLDREERPDLDKVYQMTHQLLTQRPGGWPLTVFLTPDHHIPFFAGTYFPPKPKHGMPAFPDLLNRIAEYYKNEGKSILAQGEQIKGFFDSFDQREVSKNLTTLPIKKAITLLQADYDQQFGGFGGAPKFPFPSTLDLFLQQWAKTAYDDEPDRQLLYMVSHSLQQMARGGLYDQLRGGFYRYSVDQAWMIPHFEKMLYDNAQLLPLYAQLYQISGDEFYKDIVEASIEWLGQEMQSSTAAFYSTLDADSEGVEGKFYVWSRAELEDLLDPEEIQLAEAYFNISSAPNFEGEYHLHLIADIAALAEQLNTPRADIKLQLESIKKKLLAARDQRIRPGLDTKLLTAWNALLAKGLSASSRAIGSVTGQAKARELLLELRSVHKKNGTLLVQLGEHSHPKRAFLDDYAFTLDAILEQLQVAWDSTLLDWAIVIADTLMSEYKAELGGFYYTSNKDSENLLYRPLTFTDDALPSGNAVAIKSLQRLGYLLGNSDYLQFVEKTLQSCFLEMDKSPQAHASMLSALDEFLEPGKQIIIRGDQKTIEVWKKNLQTLYAPTLQVYAIANTEQNLPASLSSKIIREITVAYVCEGSVCSEPVYEFDKLLHIIQ